MSSALRISADAYGSLGWATLPVSRSTRAPLTRNGVYGARVGSAWVSRYPDANIAVSVGSTKCFIIDEDVRNGGHDAMRALFIAHGPFPKTPLARTARGGRHWYFRMPEATRLRGKLATGVDCLSAGKYAILSPSVTENGIYRWLANPWQFEPVAAPSWLLEKLSVRAESFAQQNDASSPVVSGASMQACENWLKNCQSAVAGSNGSGHTMRLVAVVVRYFELSAESSYAALQDWNRRCSPPWSERDLRRKIDQAIRYSTFRPAMTFSQHEAARAKRRST